MMVHARYDMQSDAEGLLSKLEAAHAADKRAESRFKWALAACFVLGIPAVLGGFYLIAAFGPLGLPLLLVPFACIGAAVHFKRRDIDDAKLEAATRLVKVLRADIVRGSAVALSIDFRGYQDGGVLQGKEGGWFGPKTYKYRHPWLGLRGKLADGRIVRLSITDDVTRKEKPKRKYTKVRERSVSEVGIGIRVGGSQAAAAQGRLKAASPPPPFSAAAVSADGDWVTARLSTQASHRLQGRGGATGALRPAGAHEALRALLWAYPSLSPEQHS